MKNMKLHEVQYFMICLNIIALVTSDESNEKKDMELENFTEISNNTNVRKIIKFLSDDSSSSDEDFSDESELKQPKKAYEIIYIEPQTYINPITLSDYRNRTFENLRGTEQVGIIYKWGNWSKWSKCSRSCGGGVQIRYRNCVEKRPSGTDMETNEFQPYSDGRHKGCVGVYKRYRMCNNKECPVNLDISFRDEQCSAFNDIPFRGQYFDWESYYKEDNECELNCKPLNLKYYATLNKTVIDGTPCKKPSVYYTHFYRGRAICVQGICKAVHASGAIRGITTNDSPHRCGSVLCRPISEKFDKVKLPLGYLYLTTFVAGSSNISILQLDKSENLLVLKSSSDEYYIINGDDEPSTNGLYKFFGTLFDYKRGDDFEVIKADGPIAKAVDLLVLVKGPNPGIKYDYYIPISTASISEDDEVATQWNEIGIAIPDYTDEIQESTLVTQPKERKKRKFLWKLIGFGACTRSCGGGKKSPIFRCIRETSATRFYTPRRCIHSEKPVFHELLYQCNMQQCPAYWHVEEWEDCVCKNDIGTRHRMVKCVQEQKEGVAVEVESQLCTEEKPHLKEFCPCPKRKLAYRTEKQTKWIQPVQIYKNATYNDKNIQKNFRENQTDKSGVWLFSDWNQHCSAICGIGVEHRTIFCDRTAPYTLLCDLTITPDTTRPCQIERNCQNGAWFAGDWGDCHGDCFNLHKKRKVICVRDDVVVEDEECLLKEKPETIEKCDLDSVDYCKPNWHYSEWTECSKTCDGGIQKRSVKCLEIDHKENTLKESNKCKYVEKQPIFGSCNSHSCPGTPTTFHRSTRVNEVHYSDCVDSFPNCSLISNKERLCVLNYYRKNCCRTCIKY